MASSKKPVDKSSGFKTPPFNQKTSPLVNKNKSGFKPETAKKTEPKPKSFLSAPIGTGLTPPKNSSGVKLGQGGQDAQQMLQAMQAEAGFFTGELVTAVNKTTGATSTAKGQTIQPATPVDWEEAAKELYGGYFSIIQSVPELQDLLRRATQEGWSDAKFQYTLQQTAWFKQNSATARNWDLASQMDPATAEQQVSNRVAELQNLASSQFQVQLDETQLRKLATDSLRFGWTEQMVTNAIGLEATKSSGGLGQLASGFVGQNVRQTANAYGLKLSDDSLNQWVSGIATGQATQQSFQQYAINTAKNLFPAIAGQLDTGLTFQQVVDPFKNVAAQILEINPESIDFINPKWARAISTMDNGGQQRMMSFSEWGDYLRNERSFGYEYTSDAQTKAYEVANNLANLFGRA